MTLAGWKRAGADPQPQSTVGPPPAPAEAPVDANAFIQAELVQARGQSHAPSADGPTALDEFGSADDAAPDPIPVAAPLSGLTLAAVQDLERALSEMDHPPAAAGDVAGTSSEVTSQAVDPALQPFGTVPAAFGASATAPAPFGASATAPAPFGSPVVAPAPFGAPATAPMASAPMVSAPMASAPMVSAPPFADPGSAAPSSGVVPEAFAPAAAPMAFGTFATAPAAAQAQPAGGGYVLPTFAPAPSAVPSPAGVQFAPGVGPVPPVSYSKGSSTGKTVAIVIGVVLAVLLIFSVLIIGAVTMLGHKVATSFNTIGTFPPVTNSVGVGVPSVGVGLVPTPFEAASGVSAELLRARNETGPVVFDAGEGCAVFEPNTNSYGAVSCAGGLMNAQLVMAGATADVAAGCQQQASDLAGTPVDVSALWAVQYSEGTWSECFIHTADWRVGPTAGLPIESASYTFSPITNTLP